MAQQGTSRGREAKGFPHVLRSSAPRWGTVSDHEVAVTDWVEAGGSQLRGEFSRGDHSPLVFGPCLGQNRLTRAAAVAHPPVHRIRAEQACVAAALGS